jgi:hypothetical protein
VTKNNIQSAAVASVKILTAKEGYSPTSTPEAE